MHSYMPSSLARSSLDWRNSWSLGKGRGGGLAVVGACVRGWFGGVFLKICVGCVF